MTRHAAVIGSLYTLVVPRELIRHLSSVTKGRTGVTFKAGGTCRPNQLLPQMLPPAVTV